MKLSERMKMYESQTTKDKLIPNLPVVCRLDGVNFSKFTSSLAKPYDERLSKLMIETTKYLVEQTNANCGFTQSDEITLVWYDDREDFQMKYDGKIFKLIGDLSTLCSIYFNEQLIKYLPEKVGTRPQFDCRIWNVPNLNEAANTFMWREFDATKNSISMAARAYYSHKEVDGKNGSEKQDMLMEKGVNWNNYPAFFKRGTYIQKKVKLGKLDIEDLEKLPPKHNARKNPELEVKIKYVEELKLPPLSKVLNKVDVIVWGKDFKTE